MEIIAEHLEYQLFDCNVDLSEMLGIIRFLIFYFSPVYTKQFHLQFRWNFLFNEYHIYFIKIHFVLHLKPSYIMLSILGNFME